MVQYYIFRPENVFDILCAFIKFNIFQLELHVEISLLRNFPLGLFMQMNQVISNAQDSLV